MTKTGNEIAKDYIATGKELFRVLSIDMIRNHVRLIRCSDGSTFYVNIINKNFYTDYPCNEMSIITDYAVINFILYKIRSYVYHLEHELKFEKEFLNKILEG